MIKSSSSERDLEGSTSVIFGADFLVDRNYQLLLSASRGPLLVSRRSNACAFDKSEIPQAEKGSYHPNQDLTLVYFIFLLIFVVSTDLYKSTKEGNSFKLSTFLFGLMDNIEKKKKTGKCWRTVGLVRSIDNLFFISMPQQPLVVWIFSRVWCTLVIWNTSCI